MQYTGNIIISANIVTVTSRVVAIALGFSPIGVIKRALRLND